MFPEDRISYLDVNQLEILDLIKGRMKACDTLFMYQLLFSMFHHSKSGIDGDLMSEYYTDVTQYLNLYKHQEGIGNGYGYDVDEGKIWE